mgnify:FL=1|tara:strand:+ start:150 stop:1262 length:1113 start_codon:yes stop_codon:yes gene_type:complete
MNIYIISWFGIREHKEQRENRKQVHKQQIEWLLDKGHHPVVFHQDYDDDEFLPNVEYIDGGYNNKQTPIPYGRNALMEHFYNTDEDFAAFADNDAIWRDDLFDYDVVERIHSRSKDLVRKVDFIVNLNPQWHPFNKSIKDEQERYNKYFVWQQTGWQMKESIYIMANFKKIYGEPKWYNPENFVTEDGQHAQTGEGVEFMLDVYNDKRTVVMCRQFILNELDSYATWMEGDQDKSRYRVPPNLVKHWLSKYEIPYEDMNKVKHNFIGYRDRGEGRKIDYRRYSNSVPTGPNGNGMDVVIQLPRPMTNSEIADYLDSEESSHLDETLRQYDREDLRRPLRIKKDFSKFYKNMNFNAINKITLNEEEQHGFF